MSGQGLQFRIGIIDAFSRDMKRFKKGVTQMSESTQKMADNMKAAYEKVNAAMEVFRGQQMAVDHGFFQLSESTSDFAGRTGDFMNEIKRLGAEQKKVTDSMINANTLLRADMMKTAGTMLNMSTQAAKISENYTRMENPLLNINKASLKVVDSLNKMAFAGNASVLALELLGPTASMKELHDMTGLITQGLTRFTFVALGAAITGALVYGSLHKAAKDTVKGYEDSFNRMKELVRKAFQPMVDVFGATMKIIYNFISAVAELAIKFNDAHPILAKIIQGMMMLVPAITFLLSPLAIGIGLFAGLKAVWAFLWPLISPLVTGLAAISATGWLLIAAIVGLVAGFIIAYKKVDWFRKMVDTAWALIKKAFFTALDFIKTNVVKIMTEVQKFIYLQLTKIKAWWAIHGDDVKAMVKAYMDAVVNKIKSVMQVIKGVFQIVFPIIKGIVKIAWGAIKNILSTGVDVFLGIIEMFAKAFKGDWKAAFDAALRMAKSIWQGITGIFKGIDLVSIGKDIVNGLIKGLNSMFPNIKSTVAKIANAIPNGVKDFLGIHSPSRVLMTLGEFTGEGFAKGIASMISDVQGVSAELSYAAVPSAPSASSKSTATSVRAQTDPGLIAVIRELASRPVSVSIDGREFAVATIDHTDSLLANKTQRLNRMQGLKY